MSDRIADTILWGHDPNRSLLAFSFCSSSLKTTLEVAPWVLSPYAIGAVGKAIGWGRAGYAAWQVGRLAPPPQASAKFVNFAVQGVSKRLLNQASSKAYVNLASRTRTNHILYGDIKGGGHLYPGLEGKSVFPKSWRSDKVMHHISDIATDPKIPWVQISGQIGARTTRVGLPVRYQATGVREGLKVKVILEPAGEGIITAYPVP